MPDGVDCDDKSDSWLWVCWLHFGLRLASLLATVEDCILLYPVLLLYRAPPVSIGENPVRGNKDKGRLRGGEELSLAQTHTVLPSSFFLHHVHKRRFLAGISKAATIQQSQARKRRTIHSVSVSFRRQRAVASSTQSSRGDCRVCCRFVYWHWLWHWTTQFHFFLSIR